LDLKDAALVITRLKDLKIPYQIKDNGHAIAVPKAKADEARLGLAAKNLPGGGTVGWEIFDQSKLGATDFDRRIQFVRAISGELARTINRINVIEDARVQIVIPETKLFEVSTAPVTASVLLKMKAGESLTRNQVNWIVRLVAGSVENLKPQNVTIIDTNGNILSGTAYRSVAAPEQEEQVLTPR
jgi:flagellar M-ring protein FliF